MNATVYFKESEPEIFGAPARPISEALALLGRGLGDLTGRELVSTDEVADLQLDVRSFVVAIQAAKT